MFSELENKSAAIKKRTITLSTICDIIDVEYT